MLTGLRSAIRSISNRGHRFLWLVALVIGVAATFSSKDSAARAADDFSDDRWRRIPTGHYEVHTDLESDFAQDLCKRLEAMHSEYSTRLADFQRSGQEPPTYQVYLCAKKDDYNALTNSRYSNTGGVYMAQKKILAAFLEGQGRDQLRRTLQHEAFHQFALTTITDNIPVWLNEGMAEYFAEGIWTGSGFTVGQVPPRRIRQLQADVKADRIIPFRKILDMSLDEWNESLDSNVDIGTVQYNQAWAMVHFLVHGANGTDQYRVRLNNMLKLLHSGTPGNDAFRQAFSDNIDGFQARFVEFAKNLQPTPQATMIERQDVLADMMTALSSKSAVRFDSMSSFKKALTNGGFRLKYSKGKVEWNTESDPSIYFTDAVGRVLGSSNLYLDNRTTGPLPDIVCRTGDMRLRTRFYKLGDIIDHEILTAD